ncbi:MAG: undecaprenyl-diphosphate phosphatase, partial [Cryomorphaceae bacterium]|nr:D-alanyl-D-alanine carboxypeptidase family protein [Flavobacteriales bacterium]
IIGGIVLIAIDKMVVAKDSKTSSLEKISYKNALYIGFFQCLAMVPGTSRAAATIIGGVFNGFDKKQATEFSFLLAVPTMVAATGYDLLQTPVEFSNEEMKLLGIGMVVAFISAWIAVKIFLKIVENYGFKHFGYYRILIGGLFLIFMPDLDGEDKPDVVSSVKTYQSQVAANPDEELVNLEALLPTAVFDIKYATADNFTGEVIYPSAGAFARKPVAEALIDVQDSLKSRNLKLKVFDAYRPYSASVKLFEVYSNPDFVADPKEGSRHNRGCAVDLTLVNSTTMQELEMPTEFDDFSEAAAADYQNLPAEVLKNRSMLIGVMDHFGFDVLSTEWWHFDFRGWENYPLMDLSFESLRAPALQN